MEKARAKQRLERLYRSSDWAHEARVVWSGLSLRKLSVWRLIELRMCWIRGCQCFEKLGQWSGELTH